MPSYGSVAASETAPLSPSRRAQNGKAERGQMSESISDECLKSLASHPLPSPTRVKKNNVRFKDCPGEEKKEETFCG